MRRGNLSSHRLLTGNKHMSTPHMRMWRNGRRQRFAWIGLLKEWAHHIRHSQLNDLIWRAVKKAQIPASKEPIGLSRADSKKSDRATLVPWTRGKSLAWDVTVSDTYAAWHLQLTSTTDCAAAEKAAVNKTTNYVALAATHSFVLVSIKTSGAWCPQSAEFIEDLGRRITTITNEPLETTYLYQRLSVTLQRVNAVALRNTFPEL